MNKEQDETVDSAASILGAVVVVASLVDFMAKTRIASSSDVATHLRDAADRLPLDMQRRAVCETMLRNVAAFVGEPDWQVRSHLLH